MLAYQRAEIADKGLRPVPALLLRIVCVVELPVRHCLVLSAVFAVVSPIVLLLIGGNGAVARQRADQAYSKLSNWPSYILCLVILASGYLLALEHGHSRVAP